MNSETISRGRYFELLAKYGDPTELELPIILKNDQNSDMSFTGLKTAIQSAVIHFLKVKASIVSRGS